MLASSSLWLEGEEVSEFGGPQGALNEWQRLLSRLRRCEAAERPFWSSRPFLWEDDANKEPADAVTTAEPDLSGFGKPI